MKSFDQYMLIKSLAETIVYYDVDADHLCEGIISQIQEEGVDAFNEAWFGIPQAARAVSGVGGAIGGMAADAAGAVGGMFQRAGRYVADKYAAGQKAQAEKQVEDRLKGLADAMMALGISQQHVNATLKTVRNVVQQRGVTPQMTRAFITKQATARQQRMQAQPAQAQPAAQAKWSGLGQPAQPAAQTQAQTPVDNPLAPKTWVA